MYLSVVIAASNAGYGGNFLQRLQNCVNDKAALGCELIVVEWNPPKDTLPLLHAIKWPRTFSTKIITVSETQHKKYYNPGNWNFLEYMAKNVGIRRAQGDFVLCTNADVLFSPEMHERFNKRDFDHDHFYRANRHDFDEQGRVFQINYANGTFAPKETIVGKSRTGVPYYPNMLHFNAAGDFTMMSRHNWERTRAYPENTGYLITLDGEMVKIANDHGLVQHIFDEPIYHQYHSHSLYADKPWYMPPMGWLDAEPRGTKNADNSWGLNNSIVESITI